MKRLFVAMSLVLPLVARAQEPATAELSGYLETRHHGVFGLDPDLAALGLPGYHPDSRYGGIHRLRPTLKLHAGESATVVATVEGHAQHGIFATAREEVGDVVSVERLYFTATRDRVDLSAGKLLLRWGHGLVANPTDLFNDRSPADLRAELPGVWAAKALVAITDRQNLTLAVATEEDACCESVALARWDVTLHDTDLAAQIARDDRRDAWVGGADVKGELEVGWWLEGTWTQPDQVDGADGGHVEVEAGVDYSFDVLDQLYLAAEWLHQGDGFRGDYALAVLGTAQAGGAPIRRAFLGRDYGLLLARLAITSRWELQALGLANVHDPSGLAVPQLTYKPTGALEIVAGATLAWGERGGEYRATVPDISALPAGARGAVLVPPVNVFAWLRYYY